MDVNFMQREVVDLDGIDAISDISLHPFPHFAIPDVGQIFDAASQLRRVIDVVGSVVQEQGSSFEEIEWDIVQIVVVFFLVTNEAVERYSVKPTWWNYATSMHLFQC